MNWSCIEDPFFFIYCCHYLVKKPSYTASYRPLALYFPIRGWFGGPLPRGVARRRIVGKIVETEKGMEQIQENSSIIKKQVINLFLIIR